MWEESLARSAHALFNGLQGNDHWRVYQYKVLDHVETIEPEQKAGKEEDGDGNTCTILQSLKN